MKRKGFSLAEVVIVMGILTILLGLAIPGYAKHVKTAEILSMRRDISVLQDVADNLIVKHIGLPKITYLGVDFPGSFVVNTTVNTSEVVKAVYPGVSENAYKLNESYGELPDLNGLLIDYAMVTVGTKHIIVCVSPLVDSKGYLQATLLPNTTEKVVP